MYVAILVPATQLTEMCTWSPQDRMMSANMRTVESSLMDLPVCAWNEYCSRHEIQCPWKAEKLLLKLAGKLRSGGVERVPPIYVALGQQYGKDPLICWLWWLEEGFIAEGTYLLSVMYEFCRDANDKDLEKLANKVLDDRRKYQRVRADAAASRRRKAFGLY